MSDTQPSRKDQLAIYRARHDFEWTLLTGRLGTLITSQSFLVIACCGLYGSTGVTDEETKSAVLLPLFSVALIVCVISAVAIAINCRTLRDWHLFRRKLSPKDDSDETAGDLTLLDIPRRNPTWVHLVTTESMPFIPLLFATLWIRAILHFLTRSAGDSDFAQLRPWLHTGLFLLPVVCIVMWILIFGSAYKFSERDR